MRSCASLYLQGEGRRNFNTGVINYSAISFGRRLKYIDLVYHPNLPRVLAGRGEGRHCYLRLIVIAYKASALSTRPLA